MHGKALETIYHKMINPNIYVFVFVLHHINVFCLVLCLPVSQILAVASFSPLISLLPSHHLPPCKAGVEYSSADIRE